MKRIVALCVAVIVITCSVAYADDSLMSLGTQMADMGEKLLRTVIAANKSGVELDPDMVDTLYVYAILYYDGKTIKFLKNPLLSNIMLSSDETRYEMVGPDITMREILTDIWKRYHEEGHKKEDVDLMMRIIEISIGTDTK